MNPVAISQLTQCKQDVNKALLNSTTYVPDHELLQLESSVHHGNFVEEPCLYFENLNMHPVSFLILIKFGGTQCMPA